MEKHRRRKGRNLNNSVHGCCASLEMLKYMVVHSCILTVAQVSFYDVTEFFFFFLIDPIMLATYFIYYLTLTSEIRVDSFRNQYTQRPKEQFVSFRNELSHCLAKWVSQHHELGMKHDGGSQLSSLRKHQVLHCFPANSGDLQLSSHHLENDWKLETLPTCSYFFINSANQSTSIIIAFHWYKAFFFFFNI